MKTSFIAFLIVFYSANIVGQIKMNSSSKVGIGTLTPQELFHIKGGDIILENGQFGIKTLDPSFDLDIDGTIRFNGLQNTTDLIWDKTNSRLLISHDNPTTGEAEARLHIKSWTNNVDALFLQDVSGTGSGIGVAKIMGKRDNGNVSACFSGQVALSRHRGSDHVIDGMNLGRILFGGNHTDENYTNTLYSASILAVAEEDFTDSDDMRTSLYFQTDTAGISENTANAAGHLDTKMVIESSGEVGIGTTSPSYLLEVNGSAAKPGGGSWTSASDRKLKSNVKDFEDGLEEVLQINPVSYRYNGEAKLPTGQEFVGVIAQDIQKVAPYMVKPFEFRDKEKSSVDSYLGVDDTAIKYMLINAIKEQQKQIQDLNDKVAQLTIELSSLEKEENPTQNTQNVDLFDFEEYYLGQNVPNPYQSETTIPYTIEESIIEAQINIYNINGQLMESISLEPGIGEIQVKTEGLPSGTYSYSLVLNGRIVDTKRMVITQ